MSPHFSLLSNKQFKYFVLRSSSFTPVYILACLIFAICKSRMKMWSFPDPMPKFFVWAWSFYYYHYLFFFYFGRGPDLIPTMFWIFQCVWCKVASIGGWSKPRENVTLCSKLHKETFYRNIQPGFSDVRHSSSSFVVTLKSNCVKSIFSSFQWAQWMNEPNLLT